VKPNSVRKTASTRQNKGPATGAFDIVWAIKKDLIQKGPKHNEHNIT